MNYEEKYKKALERAVEQTKKGYELTDCDKHSWWEDFKAYSEIKPTEWCEEDERLLNIVIDILDREEHNGHLMRSDLKECVKLLKSFRSQSKQEWSEEDENHFKHILNVLEGVQGEQMEKGFNNLNSDICWFESLRLRPQPHWKPSEEQMKALENAMDRNDKIGYILRTLYDDIKKCK